MRTAIFIAASVAMRFAAKDGLCTDYQASQAPRAAIATPSGDMQSAIPETKTPLNSWRRVQGPGRGSLRDFAVLRTANLEKSDPRFAGVLLRCGETDVEIVIAIIGPLPLRARPKITLRANRQQSYFEARMVAPGTGILLPSEAILLAQETWPSSPDLSINIREEGTTIDGVIDLSGFSEAVRSLRADCVQK